MFLLSFILFLFRFFELAICTESKARIKEGLNSRWLSLHTHTHFSFTSGKVVCLHAERKSEREKLGEKGSLKSKKERKIETESDELVSGQMTPLPPSPKQVQMLSKFYKQRFFCPFKRFGAIHFYPLILKLLKRFCFFLL